MLEALERYRWLVVGLLAAPLLVGLGFLLHDRTSGPEPLEIDLENLPAADIRVYISGAVQRPGIYTVREGDRWIDVLEMAGGLTADADVEAVNLAQRLHDEDHVHISRQGEASVAGVQAPPDGKINLNTASQALLDTLPGIGETRAARIVESRTSAGFFTRTEELVERGLIPQSVYDDIVGLITVGP